ncbi:hypothetical protein GCM10009548_46750 [Streptomyces malaysiensis subsp. malaysiensis]
MAPDPAPQALEGLGGGPWPRAPLLALEGLGGGAWPRIPFLVLEGLGGGAWSRIPLLALGGGLGGGASPRGPGVESLPFGGAIYRCCGKGRGGGSIDMRLRRVVRRPPVGGSLVRGNNGAEELSGAPPPR